ncbi:MAG: antibiotic biosynthesis monooxygenase [Ginsengibacter sp.]
MITEIVLLYTREKESDLFEKAFGEAREIISKAGGYIELELQKCIEEKNKYVLIVRWNTIEDHIDGFRKSEAYKEWKRLLHQFYDPFPVVEHYHKIY